MIKTVHNYLITFVHFYLTVNIVFNDLTIFMADLNIKMSGCHKSFLQLNPMVIPVYL